MADQKVLIILVLLNFPSVFRWVRTELTVEKVLAKFPDDGQGGASVRAVAKQGEMSSSRSIEQILKVFSGSFSFYSFVSQDAGYHPYLLQQSDQMQLIHHRARVAHARAQLRLISNDFLERLIFSDEAHFCLYGSVTPAIFGTGALQIRGCRTRAPWTLAQQT
jgi:hypothetical protein